MDLGIKYQGKIATTADVEFIKRLIAENPGDSRRGISKKLCEAWNWVQPNGALRDMVCRGFLLRLHRAGYIKLIGQTLVVILDWIENKKHREAAERFCRVLNQKGIKLVGRLNVKLFFHVSSIPHHGSKAAPAIFTI